MLGIVTGLQAEAKIVAGLPCRAVSGGGQAEATRRKAEQLVAAGATGLISFGIAGALDPTLRCGDLVLSATVFDGDGAGYVGDPGWLERALACHPQARAGHIYACDSIVSSAADKASIFQQKSAIAADMESHHMARAAARHGLPFLVIRTIADTAGEALPPAFSAGLDAEGRSRPWPIIAALLTGRLGLGEVLRVARSSGRALRSLKSCRPLVIALAANQSKLP